MYGEEPRGSRFQLFVAYSRYPRSEMKLTHPSPVFKEKQLPVCHGQVRVRRCAEQKMASFKSAE